MHYVLDDEQASPDRLLLPSSQEGRVAEVVGASEGGAAAVIGDFIAGIQPRYLGDLRELTANGIGFGHDFASAGFSEDLEPDEEPFDGVRIVAQFRDDDVVMSKAAYVRLVNALPVR